MDTTASFKFLLIFLLSCILMASSSGSLFLSHVKAIKHNSPSHRRELNIHTTQLDDFSNPPFTTYPTAPVTNPVTSPATGTTAPDTYTSTPPMITVPSANPVTAAPIPPATTFPGAGGPPTNPANPTGGGGVVAPPAVGNNAPAVLGQSWCVARGGLPESVLQIGLDYACGIGGADCSTIQQGGSCYNPNSLENHASYAFNSYYQKNPVQTSCDFGGAAMVTNVNPSSGSCLFPTWSSSSGSPATVSPTTADTMPSPTTESTYGGTPPISAGTPPAVLSASNPAMGGGIIGYGESPPTASISSASMATGSLKSVIACIVLALPFITGSIGYSIQIRP